MGFRNSMVNNLKVVEDKGDWGMFIDSCFTHCQTLYGISWNSPISPRLGNNVRSLKCTIRLSTLSLTHCVAAWIDTFWLPFCVADYCRSCWRLVLSKEARSETDWLRVSVQPNMQQSVANIICYYIGTRRDYYAKNQEYKGKTNSYHVVYPCQCKNKDYLEWK
jgi:hypothetical protein